MERPKGKSAPGAGLASGLHMSLPQHLDEAASRLEAAAARIELARAAKPTLETMRDWLEALTAYVESLSDIQRFTSESIHEKLHELAGRLRVEHLLQANPSKGQD